MCFFLITEIRFLIITVSVRYIDTSLSDIKLVPWERELFCLSYFEVSMSSSVSSGWWRNNVCKTFFFFEDMQTPLQLIPKVIAETTLLVIVMITGEGGTGEGTLGEGGQCFVRKIYLCLKLRCCFSMWLLSSLPKLFFSL